MKVKFFRKAKRHCSATSAGGSNNAIFSRFRRRAQENRNNCKNYERTNISGVGILLQVSLSPKNSEFQPFLDQKTCHHTPNAWEL